MRARFIVALLSLVACGDDAAKEPGMLAERCGDTPDCMVGLVCEFQRCSQPCSADADCAGSARCVQGVSRGRVCQLPEDEACTYATDCRGRQVCGAGECRDTCAFEGGCGSDQACANELWCASTSPAKDVLDDAGNLVEPPSSDAGAP